ncbi:MAG: VOC family protein [Acidimicrobiia bacterium]|nr:VOC family protein [Acidimicrobiia bacterium]
MALHPRGVNHLAISTRDMKAQLEFFCDVLGCPLKALYWMHGVEATFHGFVELAPDSYVAFVQGPDNPKDVELGVTHAGNPTGTTTAGTMQHVAFHLDTLEEVLALRDRVRSRGVQVMGPIDHGMIQSMYFAGPENLVLEVCCGSGIDETAWVDPEVVRLCGISAAEVERLEHPAAFTEAAEPVTQPATDPTKPQLRYPPKAYERIMGMSDQETWDRFSETTPPVAAR